MEVSRAKIPDITEIVRYGRHAHEQSNWSWAVFSPSKFRRNLRSIIPRPDYVVLLARDDDGICGILIGSIDEMIQSNTRYAVDIDFFADRGGSELIDEFKRWAKTNGARAVMMADSNGGRTEAKDRFYRAKGLEYKGGVYGMRIEP